MTISEQLKQARKAKRITQEQAAKVLNIHRDTFIKYEQGSIPLDVLIVWCRHIDLKLLLLPVSLLE